MVMDGIKSEKKHRSKKITHGQEKKEMVEKSIVDKIVKIKSKNAKKFAKSEDPISKPEAVPVPEISIKEMKRKKARKGKRSNEEGNDRTEDNEEGIKDIPELLLNDILNLGGTKEDFDLLKEIKEDDDTMIISELLEDKAGFNVAELVTFMHASGIKVPKKRKKKKVILVEPGEPVSVVANNVESPPVPDNIATPTKLFFQANEPWYTNADSSKASIIYTKTGKWFKYAQQLWDNEVILANNLREKHQSNDQQWLKTVLMGGTMNDKISAHCMLAQESPVHHVRSIEALFGMSNKKSKRLAILAIDNLKELFISSILPDCKKLILFKQNDFSHLTGTQSEIDRKVFSWLVEDRIKGFYSDFIDLVKIHICDTEVAIRTKLCNITYQLLNEKPEKEQELLGILVNKIGDPDKKLASKIIYILGQLLQNHPSMKSVVSSEVQRILYRSNISERAQYYGICFLNQLQLSESEGQFAGHLIKIYFSFFKEIIDKKNVDSRMLGALLTGVNRAYPYTSDENGLCGDNIATLFKLVYVSNFNVSVQALMLLFQVSGNKPDISDRYYQALYSKLIDSSINVSSKKTFLLNLIYKSLKRDTSVIRKVAIARRLLQVSSLDEPLLACAALYTIAVANKEAENEGLAKQSIKDKTKSTSEKNVEETHREVKGDHYNPLVRNPLFSNADKVELWEFNLLAKHYHPSVVQFVTSLLEEGTISYTGDPFNDFTMMKFLDKFVFKNPKKDITATSKKFYTKHRKESSVQVYSSEFKDQKESQVNADEKFFFEYFKSKKDTPDKPKKGEEDDESEELDFAEDIKTAIATKKDKKKKKKDKDEDEDSSDAGSDFSYGEMEDDIEDVGENAGDKIYEKMLWENLDSEGESLHGSDDDNDKGEHSDTNDDDDNESEPEFDDGAFADADDFETIVTKSQFKNSGTEKKQHRKKDKITKIPQKRKNSLPKMTTGTKKKKS